MKKKSAVVPVLDDQQIIEILNTKKNPFFKEYYAFYSSWLGAITKNPAMMLLPIDDHMVHRGDGVFEGLKAVGRSVYLLDEHLQRFFISAEKIGLKPVISSERMKEIVLETLRVADQSEAMIRFYLSRGPGNFSVNPYDSIEPQFYVVIARLHEPSAERIAKGVVIGKTDIPVKSSLLAQVKSCNYLPNVLMKKEAVDRGLDFVIGTDNQGYITESATENIMIIDPHGTLVHPELDYILKGTTMMRTCELARKNGIATESRPISIADLQAAREVVLTGTTLNVLPVVEFEAQKIGNGKPGPMAKKLQELILEDMRSGLRGTPF